MCIWFNQQLTQIKWSTEEELGFADKGRNSNRSNLKIMGPCLKHLAQSKPYAT